MSVLSNFCAKHGLVLQHGQNLYVLFTLGWNVIMRFRLMLYKKLHGIQRPVVHYYGLCWNEEKMLPFMFQHYESFVDRFVIYDNYSDDRSEEIINAHLKTVVKKYSMGGQINDFVYLDIKNNCWKKSRGKADYVIVCDTDELLYHKEVHQALKDLVKSKFSIVKPSGYNMFNEEYPSYDHEHPITEQVRRGIRVPFFDKCILFDPHAIVEMNYLPGAHECSPLGKVNMAFDSGFKLLHYKYLGVEWLINRNRQYAQRLSQDNIDHELGKEYLRKEKAIIEDFEKNNHEAVTVI